MKKTRVVVHCTDTPHTMTVTTKMLHDWHTLPKPKGNGWSAIGYAYFIDQLGDLHLCRDLDGDGDVEDEVGAHAYGFNRESIGICMEGNGTYTEHQWNTLRYIITHIIGRHGIARENIVGHCDLDSHKTCPNFDVQAKLKEWDD